jgi:hypothetical protein
MSAHTEPQVLVAADLQADALPRLLSRFGLTLETVAPGEPITGSYWGGSEAGIVGTTVYARADTPVHSVLHEAAHIVCMSPERRAGLDRDAGGDDLEEAAVCYLQILLADELPGVGRWRLMADMDAWGYSFRLGDAATWFGRDAEDARTWLLDTGLIDAGGRPSFRCRM